LFVLLTSLLRHRRLLRDFVVRDLKARYVGSSMGFFWSVIFPIINLLVYMFVFRLVLNARWSDSQGALEVAVVMLAGIVVWTAFAETMSRSTNCLVENANLIQKVVFPAEVLPAYLTISSLINMCIGLPVVLAAVLWFGHVAVPQVFVHVKHGPGTEQPVPADIRMSEWDERVSPDDDRAHEFAVRIELTRGWSAPLRVPFRMEGTATRGSDYEQPADEIVFPPGHMKGLVVLVPLADGETEPASETVVLELEPGGDAPLIPEDSGIVEAGLRQVLTLVDKPPPPPDGPELARRRGRAGVVIPEADADYHPLHLGLSLVSLPLLFVLQAAFTVGLGYFLATFNLFLRDTFHLVGVGTMVWMFSTPIFYPAHLVAEHGFGAILALNPMHWLIDSYRRVVVYGLWPEGLMLVKFAVVSLALLYLGGRFFTAQRSKVPDLL